MDDFDVNVNRRQDEEHLYSSQEYLYVITKDLEGKIFLGLTHNWDYPNRTVDSSMPKYVKADLHNFQCPNHLESQDAPHQWNSPTYGTVTQYANPEDESEPLPPEGITMVRKIVGAFLYYDLAVDSTMLVAMSNLTQNQ